jgi:hypothetical protein
MVFDLRLERRCPEAFCVGRRKGLPNKGDLHDLNHWRGIMIVESLAKVVSIVRVVRVQSVMATEVREDPNGFHPERGTRDAFSP